MGNAVNHTARVGGGRIGRCTVICIPLPEWMYASNPHCSCAFTIIEAGWTQGPTFYIAKQRRFNDGPQPFTGEVSFGQVQLVHFAEVADLI